MSWLRDNFFYVLLGLLALTGGSVGLHGAPWTNGSNGSLGTFWTPEGPPAGSTEQPGGGGSSEEPGGQGGSSESP